MRRTEVCHRRWDKCFPMDTALVAKRQLIVRVGPSPSLIPSESSANAKLRWLDDEYGKRVPATTKRRLRALLFR